MPVSRARKKVSLPKQQKIRRRKRTTAAKRKQAKKFTPYIIHESGVYRQRVGVRTQEYERRMQRRRDKVKYLKSGKLPKKYKVLYKYIKKHKAIVAKKYKKEMVAVMKKRGYHWFEYRWASNYSIVGMNVQKALVGVEKFGGKKISKKKLNEKYKRAVKKARIQSYMDILGITKKKAQEIFNIFEKHLPGEFEFKALIY